MSMLISFTGAQSSGKTTLLKECKSNLNGNWCYVDEVTRYVRRRYGEQINEGGTDMTQLLIINNHIENTYLPRVMPENHYDGVMLDRCILDGVVYTEWLYENGKVSKWVYDYSRKVFKKIIPKVDIIFYTDPSIPIKDDGERSTSKKFRDEIIKKFNTYIKKYNMPIVVLKGTVEERMKTILENIGNDR